MGSCYTTNQALLLALPLTDSIKQFAAGRVLQENVLDGALRAFAEEFKDVRVREDLLDADFLLHRLLRVRMLLQVDHLHRHRLARQPIDQQLHSEKIN